MDALSNWYQEPVKLDFILFKDTKDTDDPFVVGETEDVEVDRGDELGRKWRVIFRDVRNPAYATLESRHIDLYAGRPIIRTPSQPGQRDTMRQRFAAQYFKDFDVTFETSQSISFILGTAGSKASIANLKFATQLIDGSDEQPNISDGRVPVFNWVRSSFDAAFWNEPPSAIYDWKTRMKYYPE